MRVTSRTRAIVFFIALGACLVGLAVFLNVSWIVVNWRRDVPLVLGIIFFGVIIAGVVVNTIFLVREIRRNEQQDSFLNAVTHELKTPIASIRLYLETLQSRGIDEAQRYEFYRIMLEDADRLLATVEQVLKAGEARHGSHQKHWQEVNFAKIVEETAELARLRHNLPPQVLRFGTEPPGAMLVMGKPEELRTAVFNLFDNAIKYSGSEKDIVVDLVSTDRDTIVLSVRDRGIGIPRPELKRIFSRFYRVPNSGQVKGTGLGLFIVRAVARRYGGDAYAESEGEGRGSTFTISLPRAHRA
ncbi:MAG TPA: HAMP domain-containing sensor histidine kinase [Candidatus Eisenbacteria bacterium]|jgi:two-component system sensor histidine kinase SenX3|nr:HAMP domain-containing sensor histidine kinase [Candidatus Eisenbacteria bacterium]